MTSAAAKPVYPRWVQLLADHASMIVPIGIISLVAVILVPVPPLLMDVLITANLALSAVVLLTTVYIRSPLDFSVFPSLLLATTLFRLVLNVGSTRLILTADAPTPREVTGVAGRVIEAFGASVAGGSVVVGAIIFVILIIVQLVVITKGATRISEVAARFTLDAMPGKQMAIDADLHAGVITDAEARRRREDVAREADFYGAMDGASKFIRGDAIAGVIIAIINVIGGFAIGVFSKGWAAGETLEGFTKLTIGDGLVSQVPSFIVALAAGLIVTRSGSRTDLGHELASQLGGQPVVLGITAAFVVGLAFVGLPPVPMLAIGGVLGGLAYMASRRGRELTEVDDAEQVPPQPKPPAPAPVEKLLAVDTLELEIGYGLVKLVDAKQGGDLLDRIGLLRRGIAVELGLLVPPVRVHDNMQLPPHDYRIRVRNNTVAQGAVHPGKYLAMDTGLVDPSAPPLDGDPTREPAMGLTAWWVDAAQRSRAESLGYMVVEAAGVLATHLTEVVKNHAAELLTREEANSLVAQLKEKAPKLVEEVVGPQIRPGELQKVLQNLLRERVPIRDLETIVETLSDWAPRTKDTDVLTEYVRNALRRTICGQYVETDPRTGSGRLHCVTLDPAVEDLINGYVDCGSDGTTMTLPPAVANRITAAILSELRSLIGAGRHPLVLTSPQVRASIRGMLEPHVPNVAVMAYNEVSRGVEVQSVGLVRLEPAAGGAGVADVSGNGNRLQGALN